MYTRRAPDPPPDCVDAPLYWFAVLDRAVAIGLLAARQTPDEILKAYPYLEAADIYEALRYAASLAEDETIEIG